MSHIKILVAGRHPEIMKTIIRLINSKPNWEGVAALNCNEAIMAFSNDEFDIVLLGAGLTANESGILHKFCNLHKPAIPVIQHYGGGSGLLYAEIYQALGI